MNFYPLLDINFGTASFAYCSFKKPKKLLIFIHGFKGSALKTWGDFSYLIQTDHSFSEVDVIFYDYDSLHTQANNLSISLYKLIDMAIKITGMPYPNRGLPEDYHYDSIYLVAHSLGGVISRLALLHAFDRNANWVKNCKLVLYAPAHFGSRIPQNFKECFDKLEIMLRPFLYTRYPIIVDLVEGSQLLKDMLESCSRVIVAGKGDFLKAIKVVWAENESVIISKRFLQDTVEDQIDRATHISVCKASMQFIAPLEHLIEVL